MSRLIVHERARVDVEEIAEYIARDSPKAAVKFFVAVEKACDLLVGMPGAGAKQEVGDPWLAELRIWPIKGFRNFLVCYLPLADGVEVVRVIHGARDVGRVFR